jgi:hypothetical protein
MKKKLAIILPLMALGCGGAQDANNDGIADGVREPDTISVVAPSTPKGTVSGQVLTTRLTPLTDTKVSMTIGSADAAVEATTDANGNFLFKNVPGGAQVLLTVAKQGYSTLRATATVPSAAGNIPINDGNASVGPITLTELNGSLRFNLVTSTGRPASGARATLEATPAGTVGFGDASTSTVSKVIVQATADDQGSVLFTGVPTPIELSRLVTNGGYRLVVDPVDLNSDGLLDAGGVAKTFTAANIINYGTVQVVQLPAPANSAELPTGPITSFSLRTTNIPSLASLFDSDPLRNMLRPSEPIYVTFTHPVQRESVYAILTDEFAREAIPVTVSVNATGEGITITPPAAAIRDGMEYNLSLRATSAYTGDNLSLKGYFVGGDNKTPKAFGLVSVAFKDKASDPTPNVLDTNDCVFVTFNQLVVPPAGPRGVVFFNWDVDAVGGIGNENSVGEYGSTNGFTLNPALPPFAGCNIDDGETFPLINFTTATTRFYFIYSGQQITQGVQVKVDFTPFTRSDISGFYETSWAVPVLPTTVLPTTLTKL